jgi:DNA mismatch repair protein MutS2
VEAVTTDRTPPTVGDLVWVAGFNQRGTLLSEDAGGKAQVQIGSMRTTVPMDAVQRIVTPRPGSGGTATAQPAAPRKHEAGSDLRLRARSAISPEIQLLGLRADEALTKLDAYVDQACLAGLSPFRVVHGRGTGALKRMVWDFLRGHPNVSGFVHPSEEEGGTGVTVVELRE